MFGVFYRVNDWMETLFDYESWQSHKFRMVQDESKVSRDMQEYSDPVKRTSFYWNRQDVAGRGYSEVKRFTEIPPLTQDSLSQMYYLRALPLKDGDVYQFSTIGEGRILETSVKVLGREKFRGPNGEVMAIKVMPEAHYQGILKKAGNSFMWFTDDDRRILLKFEAKVKIGAVTANLREFVPGSGPIVDDSTTKSAIKPLPQSDEKIRSAEARADSSYYR